MVLREFLSRNYVFALGRGLAIVMMFFAQISAAQTIGGHFPKEEDEKRNLIDSRLSWDPVPSVGLTYGRALRRNQVNPRPLLVYTSLVAPLFLIKDSLTAQAGISWFLSKNTLTLRGGSSFSAQSFDNNVSRGASLRYEFSLQPGYAFHRWFFGIDLSLRAAFLTYLDHNDEYKAQFPGVVDGWYQNDTTYGTLSPCIAYQAKSGVEVYLQAGARSSQNKTEDIGPYVLPFVANLGASYRF